MFHFKEISFVLKILTLKTTCNAFLTEFYFYKVAKRLY